MEGVLNRRGGGCVQGWKGVGGLAALLKNECGGEVKQGKDSCSVAGNMSSYPGRFDSQQSGSSACRNLAMHVNFRP